MSALLQTVDVNTPVRTVLVASHAPVTMGMNSILMA